MTTRLTSILALTTALSGSLLLGGAALAQTSDAANASAQARPETPAQARSRAATSSLNSGPADTVMQPRLNAQPPLSDAERPVPARPVLTPPPLLPAGQTVPQAHKPAPAVAPDQPSTPDQAQAQAKPAAPTLTLAPGATSPDPIAMPLGYYVKSPKACNEVWPGEGDLAWFTPTAFTIDFGGCEPGQFMQTGLNAWSEEQQCMTELGGDAGGYSVTYEVVAPGEVSRRATLEIDGHVEQDVWKHCETTEVPEEARFKD